MRLLDKLWNLFNNKVIGLDIGSDLIKVVEVANQANELTITSYGTAVTPQGAVTEGQLTRIDLLAEEINFLFTENKFTANKVVAAISGEQVIIRTIEIPKMPLEELDEAVKWEAKEQLPLPVDEAMLDYEILKQKETGDYELVVVAVDEKIINSYLELFELLDLKPLVIGIEPTAMAKVLQHSHPNQVIGLVDIGSQTTDVSIYRQGKLLFTRTIKSAGRYFTEEIADSYQLDLAAARDYKLNNNIFQDPELSPVIRSWVTAIYRSLDYFQVEYKDYELSKLILAGGGSKLSGLVGHLTDEFGIEIEVLNGFNWITIADQDFTEDIAQLLGVAIGLAIRGLEKDD